MSDISKYPMLIGRTRPADRMRELQEHTARKRIGRSHGVNFRETAAGTVLSIRRVVASNAETGGAAVWL